MGKNYRRQEEGQKEREKEQQQNARMMTASERLLQGALYVVNASVNRTVVCGLRSAAMFRMPLLPPEKVFESQTLSYCSSIQLSSWLAILNFAVWSHQCWQYHHSVLQCKITTARAKAFSIMINAAIRHTVQCMAAISKLEFMNDEGEPARANLAERFVYVNELPRASPNCTFRRMREASVTGAIMGACMMRPVAFTETCIMHGTFRSNIDLVDAQ